MKKISRRKRSKNESRTEYACKESLKYSAVVDAYKEKAKMLNLNPERLGKWVSGDDITEYMIIGLNKKSPKYPIHVEVRKQGKDKGVYGVTVKHAMRLCNLEVSDIPDNNINYMTGK